MAREAERDDGDLAGRPAHPIVTNAAAGPDPSPAGETILDLFDRYARENAKGVTSDTLTQARRDVNLFADTDGDIPAPNLIGRHVGEWKGLLVHYPVKAAEITPYRGLTMRQIIKRNEKVRKPTISDRTVSRYLSAVGFFAIGWCFAAILSEIP